MEFVRSREDAEPVVISIANEWSDVDPALDPLSHNATLTPTTLSMWNSQRLLESGVRVLLNWMCIASMFVRLRTKLYLFPTLWFRGTSTFWLLRRRHRRSSDKYTSTCGYEFHSVSRPHRTCGGGFAVLYKSGLTQDIYDLIFLVFISRKLQLSSIVRILFLCPVPN